MPMIKELTTEDLLYNTRENNKKLKQEINKYKQALEEIRKKLKKYDANIGDTIIANPIQDCYDTYKLINEVLNDRD